MSTPETHTFMHLTGARAHSRPFPEHVGRKAWSRAAAWLVRRVTRRPPDFVIGEASEPYLLRWWIIPRNRVCNLYLHQFLHDDDDRALHDHPWAWCSILLDGRYVEHTVAVDGVHHQNVYGAGSVRAHGPRYAHRVALIKQRPCWTLFLTGPRVRDWGFHCSRGWLHWRDFTNPETDGATVGRGCGEP